MTRTMLELGLYIKYSVSKCSYLNKMVVFIRHEIYSRAGVAPIIGDLNDAQRERVLQVALVPLMVAGTCLMSVGGVRHRETWDGKTGQKTG